MQASFTFTRYESHLQRPGVWTRLEYYRKTEKSITFCRSFSLHEGYEITYVSKGHGKFYGGHSLMNFSDGDLYFFAPGYPHYFVNERSFVQSGTLAHSVAIQFTEDCFGKELFLKGE